jgi:hypothetical protein
MGLIAAINYWIEAIALLLSLITDMIGDSSRILEQLHIFFINLEISPVCKKDISDERNSVTMNSVNFISV